MEKELPFDVLVVNSQENIQMGVSKNRGKLPKWMVKIRENPIKIDDLGVPLFLETPKCILRFGVLGMFLGVQIPNLRRCLDV